MSGPTAALAACRFITDAATMMLWGSSAYMTTLVPVELRDAVWGRWRAARIGVGVALLIAALAAIPSLVATIGEGWTDVADGSAVWAVLVDTTAGQAWIVAVALAVLILATMVVSRAACRPVAILTGSLLASLTLTGHAAMDEATLGLLHRSNDALHVLAGGAWLGALLPLLPILRALDDPARRTDAGVALRRFSVAGHGAVALVLATGALNTALVLGHWPTDMAAPYQRLLILKIALVLVMTALAIVNRYRLVPRMAGPGRSAATAALRGATIAEIALGVGAIALVAVFGLLDPASPALDG